mmetsp:Transcript_10269/g.29661  ORF Transcript_10269/g.29661 Transcript_10269/m.29661 type:complete len:109 (+) Transcript_10269:1374-1700(+)
MGRRDTSFEFEVREEERSVQVGFPNAADGAEPQDPDPLVIDLMPLDAFPNAYRFEVNHEKGSVIGSKLVTRMPAVREMALGKMNKGSAVRLLEALGGTRHWNISRPSA